MDSSTSDDDRVSSISSTEKKVRFDLQDEVFEIPNKWDRLSSKAAARRNKLVNEVCKNHKSKSLAPEHRSRHKQSKHKKLKKADQTDSKDGQTSRSLVSPSSKILVLDSSVLSTEISQKKGGLDKNLAVDSKTKKVSPTSVPKVKLKMTHRGSKDIPQGGDIVLPKITYNSDVKKAIENAVARNRILVSQESLGIPKDEYRHETVPRTSLKRGSLSEPQNRILNAEDYSTRKTERLLALPEPEQKFSELSRDVESWVPFTNGSKNPPPHRKPKRDGTIQSAWVVVPNSILY